MASFFKISEFKEKSLNESGLFEDKVFELCSILQQRHPEFLHDKEFSRIVESWKRVKLIFAEYNVGFATELAALLMDRKLVSETDVENALATGDVTQTSKKKLSKAEMNPEQFQSSIASFVKGESEPENPTSDRTLKNYDNTPDDASGRLVGSGAVVDSHISDDPFYLQRAKQHGPAKPVVYSRSDANRESISHVETTTNNNTDGKHDDDTESLFSSDSGGSSGSGSVTLSSISTNTHAKRNTHYHNEESVFNMLGHVSKPAYYNDNNSISGFSIVDDNSTINTPSKNRRLSHNRNAESVITSDTESTGRRKYQNAQSSAAMGLITGIAFGTATTDVDTDTMWSDKYLNPRRQQTFNANTESLASKTQPYNNTTTNGVRRQFLDKNQQQSSPSLSVPMEEFQQKYNNSHHDLSLRRHYAYNANVSSLDNPLTPAKPSKNRNSDDDNHSVFSHKKRPSSVITPTSAASAIESDIFFIHSPPAATRHRLHSSYGRHNTESYSSTPTSTAAGNNNNDDDGNSISDVMSIESGSGKQRRHSLKTNRESMVNDEDTLANTGRKHFVNANTQSVNYSDERPIRPMKPAAGGTGASGDDTTTTPASVTAASISAHWTKTQQKTQSVSEPPPLPRPAPAQASVPTTHVDVEHPELIDYTQIDTHPTTAACVPAAVPSARSSGEMETVTGDAHANAHADTYSACQQNIKCGIDVLTALINALKKH